MIYAGTTVNVENARRTKREDFISRFLPQLVFFADLPIEDREKELGICWDMCQESEEDIPEHIIPEAHLRAIQEQEDAVNTGIEGEVGGDAPEANGDNWGN